MIFALVVLVLLGFSMLLNMSHLLRGLAPVRVAGTHAAGPRLEEVITEDNDASAKIAVIEVDGIITGRVMDQGGYSIVDVIKAQLKRAEEDDRVKAVILKVDSPGGEVLASDDISRAIADSRPSVTANRWCARWATWPRRAAITCRRPAGGSWPMT